jgi:multidrug efflux pump
MIAFYGRTLKFVLRFQTITLLVAVATLVLTVFLYIVIPKGFFPIQDTGVIQGISQAPPAIGPKAMAEKQLELTKAVLATRRLKASRRLSAPMERIQPRTAAGCRSI